MTDDQTPQAPEWATCPTCGGTYLAGFACVACREGYGVPQSTRPTLTKLKQVAPTLSESDARFLLTSRAIIFFAIALIATLFASIDLLVPEDGPEVEDLLGVVYGFIGVIFLVLGVGKVRSFRAHPGLPFGQRLRERALPNSPTREALGVLGLNQRWIWLEYGMLGVSGLMWLVYLFPFD